MPWTETTRRQYRRDDLRYASDMTDAEWALIEPHLPPPRPLGRPRTTDLRAVVDALLYMLASGCQWRLLPSGFPPYSTVQRFFYQWRADGLWHLINHDLMMRAREAQGRAASPSAGVIDSQSVKTTEAGGPRRFDAGKKIKGRKRHILTDTTGLMVPAMVHEASVQDRDGAVPLLASIRHEHCLGCVMSLPTAPTLAPSSRPRSQRSAGGASRSSSAPTRPKASSCCHAAGWSSARWHGSTATAASPRTSRRRSRAPRPGSSWPASNYLCDGWRGNNQPIGY